MDPDRAALDPRHQEVSLDLLGHEEQAGDHNGRRKAAVGDQERDRNRGHRAQEGAQDRDNLRDRHPDADQEGVLADGEETYGPAYEAHDGAQ